jgi:hypothetical protein
MGLCARRRPSAAGAGEGQSLGCGFRGTTYFTEKYGAQGEGVVGGVRPSRRSGGGEGEGVECVLFD